MTENDKNMIAGLPFEAAAKEIGAIVTGLQSINQVTEDSITQMRADEALIEIVLAEVHFTKAQQIINGEADDGQPIDGLFLKLREALNDVRERIRDEMASEDNANKLTDLAQAKSLLSDAAEITERAEARATNLYKGTLQPRIFLGTWAEYFTFDPTTPKVRYCHIPLEYRH